MANQFNFDDAVKALQAGKNLNGKDGVLTGLIKQLTESALQAELEQHLSNEQQPNRKNGSSTKTVKSSVGNFELDTPRDRSCRYRANKLARHLLILTNPQDQFSLLKIRFQSHRNYKNLTPQGQIKAPDTCSCLSYLTNS